MNAWLQAQLDDLLSIREQLEQGVPPTEVQRRHRPRPMAVGDGERPAWARGLVLDCRGACCTPLDFETKFSSGLNLPFLEAALKEYPDQALLSYLMLGVRLEADVELQSVFIPHLTSLPAGFQSVEKEIRRLEKLTWYDFFDSMPFSPAYYNGQVAVARKLEPDRFRRSTEGGGPRVPTFDASGLQAISINAA